MTTVRVGISGPRSREERKPDDRELRPPAGLRRWVIGGGMDLEAVSGLPPTPLGRWGGAVGTRDRTLATLLPRGFDSYARIMHPAWRVVGPDSPAGVQLYADVRAEPVAWADVAARQAVELGRQSRWGDICGSTVGVSRSVSDSQGWTYPADEGVMREPKMLASLFALLGKRSDDTTGCNCGFWTGYSIRRPSETLEFASGYETYWLYRTTFGALARWWTNRDLRLGLTGESPDMFWPDDESWFIAGPFNCHETYVGGAEDLIDEIASASDLEAFEVELSDSRR